VSAIKALIVDCLARGGGKRYATVDVVGAGPRAVAGVLEAEGVSYDLTTAEAVLAGEVDVAGYDVLLVSAMSSDERAVERVKRVWDREAGGLSILGGPITADTSAVERLGFDIGVVGEGEKVLTEIVRRLPASAEDILDDIEGLRGLVARGPGGTLFTGVADHLTREELARFKPSTRAIRSYPMYWASRVYVEVVRGCSNYRRPRIRLADGRSCTDCGRCEKGRLADRISCPQGIPPGCGYCSVPALYGPARSRDALAVVEEVEELVRLGVTRVVLSAPDFLDYGRDLLVHPQPLTDPRNPPPNLEELSRLLEGLSGIPEISRGEAVLMIENVKPNLVSEDVARLLGRYLKGTTVHLGVETGDEEHSRMLGRPNTVEEAIRAVRLLRRYGLRPYVYFIHGLPGQSRRTVEGTLRAMDEAFKAGAEKVTIYRFRPLPMTAFEGFSEPPPAVKDRLSALIYERARKLNLEAKLRLRGSRVRAVVATKHPVERGKLIAYPLRHGPVMLVPGSRRLIGRIVEAVVEGVLGDRAVTARVVRVYGRVGKRR